MSKFRKIVESILTEYSQEAVDKARDINKQISIDLINAGYPAFWIKNLINNYRLDHKLSDILEYYPDFKIPEKFESLEQVKVFCKQISDLSKKLADEKKIDFPLDDNKYNDLASSFTKHHTQFNKLHSHFDTTNINDKNINNTDSENSLIQNIDEVKKFMEGSKAVDKFNRPLALYIGTATPVENKFDFKHKRTGSYSKQNAIFTTTRKDIADGYRTNYNNGKKIQNPNTLNKVYVNIKNPLVIDFKGANFNYINGQYYHEYNDYPYATDIQGNQIERNFNGTRTVPAINQVVAYAKKQGYDGVIAKSIQDFRRLRDNESDLPYKNDEYIVFNPNQIMIVGRE